MKKKDFEPKHNSEYSKQEYWQERFKEEEAFEWLVSYKQCRHQLLQVLFGDNYEEAGST